MSARGAAKRAVSPPLLAGAALLAALAAPVAAAAQSAYATIFAFPGRGGGLTPEAGVIPGPSGVLYGTTDSDGLGGGGVVFQLTPPASGSGPWKETVLHRFTLNGQASYPLGLLLGASGELYGVTLDGGQKGGSGAAFELAPPDGGASGAWSYTLLHVFTGGSDGAAPSGGLVAGPDGALYGTTLQGGLGAGQTGDGVVFQLTPPADADSAWTEAVLHRFRGAPDGSIPQSPLLVRGKRFYGVTTQGGGGLCGNTGCGTVFALHEATSGGWPVQVLYSFQGGPDGSVPVGSLVADAKGALYGATAAGGVSGGGTYPYGTVFRLNPPASAGAAWTKDTLYAFKGGADGEQPAAGLWLGPSGVLYGTTEFGGAGKLGTVFSLTPPAAGKGAWTETILHAFSGTGGDGGLPTSRLVQGADGALYGTTLQGGKANAGTVFRVTL